MTVGKHQFESQRNELEMMERQMGARWRDAAGIKTDAWINIYLSAYALVRLQHSCVHMSALGFVYPVLPHNNRMRDTCAGLALL